MASTYVNNLRLEEIGTGEQSGTWGDTTNTNLEIIGQAVAWGTRAIANASTDNITIADGALDADRCLGLKLTGGGQACTVTLLPNTSSKTWFMYNATAADLTFTCGSGANVVIPAGQTKVIATDGLGSGGVVHDLLTAVNLAGTTVVDDLTVSDDLTVGDDLAVTGLATVGGTLGVTGIATFTDDIIIGDGKTIGSASDVDAITIAANGQVTLTQTLIGTALDISGDIDVDGTTNLDVVDIDGAVDMATTLAVAGNVDFNGDLDVDGTTNLDVVDIDGAVNMATTALVTGVLTTASSAIINTASNGLPSLAFSHSNGGADNFLIGGGVPGTSNSGFSIRDVDASANRIVIDSSGEVGIGIDVPLHALHINASEDAAIPTNAGVGVTAEHQSYFGFHNISNSATYSGIAFETRTTGASRWLIANEWQGTYLGDLVFRARDGGSSSSEILRMKNNGSVTIGSDNASLTIGGTTAANDANLTLQDVDPAIFFHDSTAGQKDNAIKCSSGAMLFLGGANANNVSDLTYHARFDSNGKFMVGKSATGAGNVGSEMRNGVTDHAVLATTSGNASPLALNRQAGDGAVVQLYNNNAEIGQISIIGTNNLSIGGTVTNHCGLSFATNAILPMTQMATNNDTVDIGADGNRYDNIFATNGTINTSDQNEKQDIAGLTSTEMLVAKRLSALFKTFRWKSKVVSKGDDARTHTGTIAQDVQAAFSAEGLDAGNYSLFTSGSWWEHNVDVEAVEANENAGVKAVDAYTRTDQYYIESEAPEGSTKKTTLGIRYHELLSFLAAYNEQRFAAIEARLTALEG